MNLQRLFKNINCDIYTYLNNIDLSKKSYVSNLEKVIVDNFKNIKEGTNLVLEYLNNENITINIKQTEKEVFNYLLEYITKNDFKFKLVIKSDEVIGISKFITYTSTENELSYVSDVYITDDVESTEILEFKLDNLIDDLIDMKCSNPHSVQEIIISKITDLYKKNLNKHINIMVRDFDKCMEILYNVEFCSTPISLINSSLVARAFNDASRVLNKLDGYLINTYLEFNKYIPEHLQEVFSKYGKLIFKINDDSNIKLNENIIIKYKGGI